MWPERRSDAERSDRYLERLGRRGTIASAEAGSLEPGVAETARLLRRALARSHPSFRFEDRLAGRLRAEAGNAAASGADAAVIAFPIDARSDVTGQHAGRRSRGYLVGGAIASGVSLASLAGAVIAWRRTRGGPIARTGAAMERSA